LLSLWKSTRGRLTLVSLAIILAVTGTLFAVTASHTQVVTKTWTTNADFDLGVLQGVEHTTVADQLQLSKTSSTFPFMWVANAGEATVSKIDTNTGKELARYKTFFSGGGAAWSGAAPSRTAVDSDGNVYVANRHFDGRQPLIMKILATGGIDRNGNGQIDTSADISGVGGVPPPNGVIEPSEMKPLVDSNGNGIIEATEIQDERIAWAARVGGAGSLGRSLCIGTDGNIWLGTFGDSKYYKVSSANGAVLAGPHTLPSVQPYGCAVDSNGNLWSASLSNRLGRIDTTTGASASWTHVGQDYGIAVGNGKIYQANLSGYTYTEFNPATNTFSTPAYTKGTHFQGIGISVDQNGDIFVSRYQGGMYKFKPDGTLIWSAPPQPGTGEARGAIVDSNGNVWVNHLNNNNVSKYNGATGAPMGVFPVGQAPYTYSDATGIAAMSQTTPTGFWTVVFDGGSLGAAWGKISWNGNTPAGTTLEVRERAADIPQNLENQNYALVSSGVQFSATGRYIQIQVKFVANQAGTSPVLFDLTAETLITNQPPTANAGGPYSVPEGGSVVLNGSGTDPDNDPLTYSWDLDNNGSFETTGQNPAFSAAGRDGPSTQAVVLKVCDDDNACTIANAAVNITNVAPKVTATGATINENGTATVSGNLQDPGAPDTFTVVINWGDGVPTALTLTAGATNYSATHQYLDDNPTGTPSDIYAVTITATDDDGGVGTANTTVTVNNIAPVITGLTATPLVVLGNPTNVSGAFTDVGTKDTHTVSIDWGDTTNSAGTVTETNGSGTFTASHVYTIAQFYTITITLKDDDTGTATQKINVIVTAAGKMTGGGSVDTGVTDTVGKNAKPQTIKATHGFELFVNPDLSTGGNLQYNDHRNGDNFHVTGFTSIIMINDPLLNPGNPLAKHDTAIVKGVGRLNKVEGVKFEAVITDNGEPGKTDTFSIKFPGGESAGVSGKLDVGNHQAHPLP